MQVPLGLAVGMQELDRGEGLGHQGPQILHEVIPLLSSVSVASQLPLADGGTESMPISPTAKNTFRRQRVYFKRYNALPTSSLVCKELCHAGSLCASDLV